MARIEEEAQRLRLMTTSHLDDGEFARLLYDKVGGLIGPVFAASLERAVAAGDAVADRQRAAQSVLVRPSYRADGGADAAAGRALSCPTAMPPISNGSFANSSCAASDLTKPQLLLIWTASCRRIRDNR